MSGITHMLLGPLVVSGGAVVNVDVNSGAVNGSASVGTTTVSIFSPFDISAALYDPQGYAWDISQLNYASTSFSIVGQETVPTGIFFKPDGTKMYITGSTGDDVNEYDLSRPWFVNTASYVQNFSVSAQDTNPTGVSFSDDGTNMYVIGLVSDSIHQYSLSSAWDVSTASFLQSFSVGAQDTAPSDLFFKPDGTKVYMAGNTTDYIFEYDLSTAWDISTCSYVQAFDASGQETAVTAVFFSTDGTRMFVMGTLGDDINQYNLSTPWDISSASFITSRTVSSQDTVPQGMFFSPNGGQVFVVGSTNDTVYQYIIGGFQVSTQEATPNGVFFKTDGTKMYIIGTSGDDVNEYNLSTAWDASTASYVQAFSVAAQETSPNDLYFSDDGTRMYIIGSQADEVNQYSLSTAWDVSSASFVQLKSVTTEEAVPNGLFFSPDGAYMFITGTSGDSVDRYSLGTNWDISTAVADQVFSVSAQMASPLALSFSPDGKKMFVLNSIPNLYQYSLSTAWDLTSASFVQSVGVNASSPTANSNGLYMKQDGSGLFIVGPTQDRVYFYEIA